MSEIARLLLLTLLVLAAGYLVAAWGANAQEPPPTTTVTVEVERTYQGRGARRWAEINRGNKRAVVKRGRTIVVLRRTLRRHAHHKGGSVTAAICAVFGGYCAQALSVARCESGLNVYATNGQYLGLFQMGTYARSRFGHGWDAFTQAQAAYAYFVASGRDWSPWTCQP